MHREHKYEDDTVLFPFAGALVCLQKPATSSTLMQRKMNRDDKLYHGSGHVRRWLGQRLGAIDQTLRLAIQGGVTGTPDQRDPMHHSCSVY